MSGDNGVSFGAGAGQLQNNASNQQTGGQPASGGAQPGGEPKYITMEQAQALITQAREETIRQAQSLTDKAESRIQKTVAERFKSVEDAYKILNNGQDMPAEQKEAARQKVIAQVLSEQPSNQQPGGQGGQPGANGQQMDPDMQAELEYTDRFTTDLYEEYGLSLEEEDPEVKNLNFSSPGAFRKSLRPALEAKKVRLAAGGGQQTNQQQTQTKPGGQLPINTTGMNAGNPIANINDPDALFKMAREQGKI